MIKIGVTTAINPRSKMLDKAKMIAKELELKTYTRRKQGIRKMLSLYGLDYLYVVEKERIVLKNSNNDLFWHPGTSVIKLWDQGHGKGNLLLKATAIEDGDIVLDCTLGYGSDAIVMASKVGTSGKVIGLEASEHLAYLAKDGMENYTQVRKEIIEAVSRIKVLHANYIEYLAAQADNSIDIIYFDPMFQNPNTKSKSLNAIRDFAEMGTLEKVSILEALRVCRKRVVVKERIGSGVFKKLGITKRVGEIRFGSVVYGIIEKKNI